uniref:Si:ch211-209f23.6 n=1 Tax=Sinocyclocheilus rhinocerous TaxID=307959 RepID=A0A673KX47_9TELE
MQSTIVHIHVLFILHVVWRFSAEISVFVQTGDSFDDLSWKNDKSESIVKYTSESKKEKRYSSYKDRMDFNDKTFSLTLKNMQKTDSGLYTAVAAAESDNNIVTYRVSVIDTVEAPVLTVNSSGSSDSCTVSFTCRGHDFTLSSTFVYGSCSREEVTSQINTLILFCSVERIICNHSNPVSWKEDRINITQLCEENEITQMTTNSYGSSYMTGLIIVFVVVGVIVFAGLVLYCYCKNKKGMTIL